MTFEQAVFSRLQGLQEIGVFRRAVARIAGAHKQKKSEKDQFSESPESPNSHNIHNRQTIWPFLLPA
jgi:hypothetical protein